MNVNVLPSLSPHLKIGCGAGMYSGRGGGSWLGFFVEVIWGLVGTVGPVGSCPVFSVVGVVVVDMLLQKAIDCMQNDNEQKRDSDDLFGRG